MDFYFSCWRVLDSRLFSKLAFAQTGCQTETSHERCGRGVSRPSLRRAAHPFWMKTVIKKKDAYSYEFLFELLPVPLYP